MVLGRVNATPAYQRLRAFTQRYERFLMPAMLLGGTALDAIQFRILKVETTFLFMAVYAAVCVGAIAIMAAPSREDRRVTRYAKLLAPFLQQFTIGALLSTALLFYWFSGALSASWPVLGFVALLMVSNEVLRTFFTKPFVQVVVFAFALFSLATSFATFVFNSISPWVFVAGGVASLLVMAGVLVVVIRIGHLGAQRRPMWYGVLTVFALMHIGYFLNVLPPIPLSLRDAGMYSNVTRSGDTYLLDGPEESWIARILPGQKIRVAPGQPLYAFTAIYAPAELSTVMVHRWEYYDDVEGWVTTDRLSFRISGGRSEGYRGYSKKSTLTEGAWRVTVETTRGQVLGRIRFSVVPVVE